MTVAIEDFLGRLEGVRKVGPDRWMARCPAHSENHGSLSVRLAEDGRILVHDFGMECDINAICNAMRLGVADLMPPSLERPYMRPEERGSNRTGARLTDLIEHLGHEAMVAALLCAQIREKAGRSTRLRKLLPDGDWERLAQAARSISDVRARLT